ncbi:MAG: hypothetical protein GX922_00920 [Firmicutes bacterium]|nr:hypothetical protein [Bacillota bacterium]
MLKKLFAFFLFLFLILVIFAGAVQANEVQTDNKSVVELLRTEPLQLIVGEQFAVNVRLTPETSNKIRLTALSSGGKMVAESELLLGLEAGVAREVILYGKCDQVGLTDIAQVQILAESGEVLETHFVNALLLQVQEKPTLEDLVLLRIGTFSVSAYKGGEFTLKFSLKNLGTAAAKNVALHFNSEQVFLRGNSNVLQIKDIAAGASEEITIKMGLTSTESPVFVIPVNVTCALSQTEKVSFDEIITVTAKDLGIEAAPAAVGTPRVFLKKYTLSQNSILAGDTVKLTLYVENSSNREVRNLKLSLAAIPSEESASGTVFSPVNSSNSFYVERIGAKSTYTKSIDIYVDPNATAKTYLVPLEILYEDQQGTAYSVSEMVNIPVLQESRLQVVGVEVPPVAALNEPTPISVEFVNVGKVALKNLMVNIEGDFPKENASYFLASFEIGQSEFYQAYITPQQEGELTGKVIFTYTDNSNQEVVTEYPFELNVQQMEIRDPGMPVGPERPVDTPRSGLGKILLIGSIVLILALIGLVVYRKRVKRGEMFDEEL